MRNATLLTKQALFGAALAALLKTRFDAVQLVGDERAALDAMKSDCPALLIIDATTIKGPLSMLEGALTFAGIPVLVITAGRVDEPEERLKHNFFKGETLVSVLASGDEFLDAAIATCKVQGSERGGRRRRYGSFDLTKREYDVATLVARGLSNRAISHAAGLQEQSVKNLVSVIMRKLNCENRVQVALKLTQGAAPAEVAAE